MDYYIADTHFLHEGCMFLSERPFKTIEEHDETIIMNWNNKVTKDDNIYIIGDFCVSNDGNDANKILERLNGNKYFIHGNHDMYLNNSNFNKYNYKWIKHYHEFRHDNKLVILFHYPILEWNKQYLPSIHLYGHVHETRTDYFNNTLPANAVNVGVDLNNFTPLSMEDIENIIKKRVEDGKKLSYII